jgi:hypothetical protein
MWRFPRARDNNVHETSGSGVRDPGPRQSALHAATEEWCDRLIVTPTDTVLETVNAVYLAESRRVLATLIRLLGDFDAAEEALHDAFRAAL